MEDNILPRIERALDARRFRRRAAPDGFMVPKLVVVEHPTI